MDYPVGLLLLLERLSWPGCLARERAGNELVRLLKSEHAKETERALIEWMTNQKLESMAANALAIPFRLGLETGTVIDCAKYATAISVPSLLSDAVLREMGDAGRSHPLSALHSKNPPSSFVTPQYFNRYRRSYVPAAYDMEAESLEKCLHIPFRRQWAYEWNAICVRAGIDEAEWPDYFLSSRSDKESVVFDTQQSEAFRSAFLRALAWAADGKGLSEDAAVGKALSSFPINVTLWCIRPTTRPTWWPVAGSDNSAVDLAPASILQQIQESWQQQSVSEKVVVWGSGRAGGGENSQYDLEIFGLFQRSVGPKEPEVSEVVSWLHAPKGAGTGRLSVTSRGELSGLSLDDYAVQFGDWNLLPTAVRLATPGMPRWQAHWMRRLVWVPIPAMLPEDAALGVDESGLYVVARDGARLSQWMTWHNGLRERELTSVPPDTGQCLLVDRNVVESFASMSRARFCWVINLRVFTRPNHWSEFEDTNIAHFIGATSIVM